MDSEDDPDGALRAALPPGLFSDVKQASILDIEHRTWQTQQRRPWPLRVIAHLWQQLVGKER